MRGGTMYCCYGNLRNRRRPRRYYSLLEPYNCNETVGLLTFPVRMILATTGYYVAYTTNQEI